MGLARNEECSESGAGAVVGRKVNSPTKSGDTTGSNGGDDDTGFAEKQSPAQQLAIKWYTVIPGHATLQPGERVEIKFRLKVRNVAYPRNPFQIRWIIFGWISLDVVGAIKAAWGGG